ncbi:N-acyl-D-glucosamine 2-epimerase [Rhodohalobacter sp. SW132]|uniref:AGE family epimerase/isomerase n=1 Tax=Rhodohalobacter sp. SW132 TaxID=2293433 RepID=UPI000E27C414|nr:AGE family epimerase/isomerase [Rhodohalobacter sp. SW132]REL24953.1 N-acyl-D-glucosamine 2-epimerase [Rhodohalobacter sp. SW132]
MKPNSSNHTKVEQLRTEMASELQNEILPFWIKNAVDPEFGGFIGRLDNSGHLYKEADKAVILNARLLWTFSAAYRVMNDEHYLELATRSFHYLENHFYDSEFRGFYWSVDFKGTPVDTKKHAYAQAFAIYAYSEYFRASNKDLALKRAVETFEVLEEHGFDPENGGYTEAFDRQWNELEDARLGDGDADEKRSMNTHLHIMEAYTNLYRVWPDSGLESRLKLLVNHMLEIIYDPEIHHFIGFFTDRWKAKSKTYSYGHDIEAAWLLIDAAETLGDDKLIERTRDEAWKIGRATLDEGVDRSNGGMYYTGNGGRQKDRDFHWWVQAEAIVGFLYIHELTGEDDYLDAAAGLWQFIQDHIRDKKNGEWFFRVSADGVPYEKEDKIGPWKCPYHNTRACLVLMERFTPAHMDSVDVEVRKVKSEK